MSFPRRGKYRHTGVISHLTTYSLDKIKEEKEIKIVFIILLVISNITLCTRGSFFTFARVEYSLESF